MRYYVDESLTNFQFWSGAKENAASLTYEQLEAAEQLLEEVEPAEGWSDTAINDMFWFEFDWIREQLGITEDGENMDEIVANMDRAHYHLSDGTPLEFNHDGTEVYGYYNDAASGRSIFSSNYEWDGDEESIVEKIIEELEGDEIEGCGVLVTSLDPRYDSRASFYGKAKVITSDDGSVLSLISYDTTVATYDRNSGELFVFGYYSSTTARHIREFAKQLGITLPSGKDIKGKYYA